MEASRQGIREDFLTYIVKINCRLFCCREIKDGRLYKSGERDMKTIYVRDLVHKVVHDERLNLKRNVPAALFLCAMFFLGRAAAEIYGNNDTPPDQVLSSRTISSESENWGLGFGAEGQKPTGNASIQEMKQYDAYYMAEGDEKVLYLTFDCGYENGNTAPILDALKKHNAPATFFVVGHFLESAPDIVKRMVEDGHTVGNHTYHHYDMSKISDQTSFQKEMNDVSDKFREITGTELAMYYRPPQGKYSTANLQMAKDMGYSTFFWSLAYVDWDQDAQPSHEEALKKLMGRVHPGAIVLLHSTSKTNGEILDEVLTKWEEMGYTFRPLADFLQKSSTGADGGNVPGSEAGQSNGGNVPGSESIPGSGGGRILQDETPVIEDTMEKGLETH